MQIFTPISQLNNTLQKYLSMFSFRSIGLNDLVDVIIISFIVYQILCWVQLTRAWTLFKGIMILFMVALIASFFHLNTIYYLLSRSFGVGVMAVIVIFQPELRNALEQLGRRNFLADLNFFSDAVTASRETSERTVDELVKGAFEMSATKTGALIVIEQSVALGEYERTGIPVDGLVTRQLLVNIFEKNTPLHDGAVFIRDRRVVAATCYLPLSDNMSLSKNLGTRHRAALGISEVSDSMTIVVSEETGNVSVAEYGKLTVNVTQEELRKKLTDLLPSAEEGRRRILRGMIRNERKTDE